MSALGVFRSAFLVGRRDVSVFWSGWKVWLVAWVLRVTTMAAMWVLLGRMLGSEELLRYLLIGQAVMTGPQAAGFTTASSSWDRMNGTYPQLVIAPTRLFPAIAGRTSVWLLNAIATSSMTFLVLLPLFGIGIRWDQLPLLGAGILAVCLAGHGLALFLGALVVRAPRLRNLVHNLSSTVIVAISGAIVPVAFWPEWVGQIAAFLPVMHGLAAVRLLFADAMVVEILQLLSLELLVAVGWTGLAALTMDWMADLGRRDGSIETAVS